MKKNQKGFSGVELFLGLVIVALIGGIGFYVMHANNDANSSLDSADVSSNTAATIPKGTSAKAVTKLTLDQAVTQSQDVYKAYEKEVVGGQVLQDKGTWATANGGAAEDLQFINNHKTWFTTNFVTKANGYKTDNKVPEGGEFMMCYSSSANYNSDLKVTGDKLGDQSATLTATYTSGGQSAKTTHTLPFVMKAVNGAWAIDSVDLGSCSSNQLYS